MQTRSPVGSHSRTGELRQGPPPIRRMVIGSWAVGAALVFLVFLVIGVHERAALPLVGILAAALSAELVAGAICVLKGYQGVGWLALIAWLAFPIGSVISTGLFPGSWEPGLLGSAFGAGVILAVGALAAVTAVRPARWGSHWEKAGWNSRSGL